MSKAKAPSLAVDGIGKGLVDRCRRYLLVWRWLIRCNLRDQPLLLPVTIIAGIGGRLGTLVGFALSVKCAAFILKPELMVEAARPFMPADPHMAAALLALIPGLVFCGGAGAQVLYNGALLRLRNGMAERLALAVADVRLAALSSAELGKGTAVKEIAADMRIAHGKLVTIEVMLVNLIVTGSVLLLALVAGLLIDSFLMSVVTAVGVTFALATAAFRHFQSQDTARRQETAVASEKAKMKALPAAIQASDGPARRRKAVGRKLLALAATHSDVKSVDQRFNNVSTLILDLGQALIVVTFLMLLTGADTSQMPMLIILVLIFRFFVSYLQTIAHTLIKLAPHYPFLVTLWRTLRHVEPPQASGTRPASAN